MKAQKQFQRIYVEIGNICNLQCTFCPEVERDQKRLDESEFQKILDQLSPLTDQICFHVMGEPLAHPLFPQFVEIAQKKNIPVEITTNGTLLNQITEDSLLQPIIRQVNFSLQSYFDNFPQSDPETYLKKIFSFVKKAMNARPDIYLNFRLWNLSERDLKDELNSKLLLRIESEFQIKINPNLDLRLRKSKKLLDRLYLHYDSRFEWPNPKDPVLREKGTCHGTRSHIAIHADGSVVPCCLDKEANINLGNIFHMPLTEILDSTRFKNIRQGFEEKRLVEELCKKCQFATRFPI